MEFPSRNTASLEDLINPVDNAPDLVDLVHFRRHGRAACAAHLQSVARAYGNSVVDRHAMISVTDMPLSAMPLNSSVEPEHWFISVVPPAELLARSLNIVVPSVLACI